MKAVGTVSDFVLKTGANNRDFPSLPKMTQAVGSRVYSKSGQVYLDMSFSSLYNLLGHNISELQDAIAVSAPNPPPLAPGATPPACYLQLAPALQQLLPEGLQPFLFLAHDTQAMDSALKLAYLYWQQQSGAHRSQFIGFAHAQHGYSLGCAGLNRSSSSCEPYSALVNHCELIPFPETWLDDEHTQHKEELALERLQHFLRDNHQNCCAFVFEPLIQSCTGMRICRPTFLDAVCKLVRSYGLLIIADERFTGMYRCGHFLASEHLRHQADIVTLGRTLTNNTTPIGAVCINKLVKNAVADSAPQFGFEQTIAPDISSQACLTVQACIDVVLSQSTQQHLQNIQNVHKSQLHRLSRHPIVKNVRYLGTIGAFDIICERHNQQAALQFWFRQSCLDARILLSPAGKTVFLVPPFCLSCEDLHNIYQKIDQLLQAMPLHYITACP